MHYVVHPGHFCSSPLTPSNLSMGSLDASEEEDLFLS